MSHSIFISHESSSSLDKVKRMAEWFEQQHNIMCWYAPRNLDNSGAGKEYDDEIVDAIREAKCIIVLLNDEALKSVWVKREVSQAEKQGKLILPYVISELTINNGLLMRLEDKHLITAYPNIEEKYPILLRNVNQVIGREGPQQETFMSPTPKEKPATQDTFDLDFDEGMAFLEVEEERDAFDAFLRSAMKGNKKAHEHLFAIMHLNNRNVEFIDDDTWDKIEELSDNGEIYADLLMHYRYYGMGTQNDIALKYLKKAMDSERSGYALLQLGICYRWGLGTKMSDVLSLHYFKKALEQGCKEACSYIGQLYRYGGEKIARDYCLAEKFLRQGIEMGDKRCYHQLYYLYRNQKQVDKCREMAHQMIDQGLSEGYTLMGDSYSTEYWSDDSRSWYEEAVKHKARNAWGKLAILHFNFGDTDEAYELARRGCAEGDSFSYYALGYLLENDEKYDEAWKYYEQRMQKFSIGAVDIAGLYINHGYLPESYNLDNLVVELQKEARLPNAEAIKMLFKLLLERCTGEKHESLTYDDVRKLPEAPELLHLGAIEGDDELCYFYGKLLVESSGRLHDPYNGMKYLERAIEKKNLDAFKYAFEYRRKKHDEAEVKKLAVMAVENGIHTLDNASETAEKAVEAVNPFKMLEWLVGSYRYTEQFNTLNHCMEIAFKRTADFPQEERNETLGWMKDYNVISNLPTDARFIIYGQLYALCTDVITDDMLDDIHAEIDYIKEWSVKAACLSKVRNMASLIYPGYDHEAVWNGQSNDDENRKLFMLFYAPGVYSDIETVYEDQVYKMLDDAMENGIVEETASWTDDNNACDIYWQMCDVHCKMFAERGLGCEMNIHHVSTDRRQSKRWYNGQELYDFYCSAMQMLMSARPLLNTQWPTLLQELSSDEGLLHFAEKINSQDIQLFLLLFVELRIDINSLLLDNVNLRHICKRKDLERLTEFINKRVKKVGVPNESDSDLLPAVDISDEIFEYQSNTDIRIVNNQNSPHEHTIYLWSTDHALTTPVVNRLAGSFTVVILPADFFSQYYRRNTISISGFKSNEEGENIFTDFDEKSSVVLIISRRLIHKEADMIDSTLYSIRKKSHQLKIYITSDKGAKNGKILHELWEDNIRAKTIYNGSLSERNEKECLKSIIEDLTANEISL